MATRPIASVLNPKGKMVTSLDVDRENFEKHQVSSVFSVMNRLRGSILLHNSCHE